MTHDFFSGSYGGDDSRLQDDDVLECKICWYVYEPDAGDPYWQIPPGTPFAALPDHWTCPHCDGAKGGFMVVSRS